MLVISRLFDDNRVYYPKEITNDESTNVLNTHSLKLCSEHKICWYISIQNANICLDLR